MKNFSWFLVLAFMAFACQLQNEEVAVTSDASGATNADYSATATTSDGKTFTFNVNVVGVGTSQNKVPGISHVNFNFFDCDGEPLNLANVVSITLNGVDVFDNLSAGDGRGNDCFEVSTMNTIKLDGVEANNFKKDNVIVITLDTQSSGGNVYIKAGSSQPQSGGGCFGPYAFEGDCDPDECYDEGTDTAWGAGTRYVQRGNWATYTAYQTSSAVNIYAGRTKLAGSLTFSEADANGDVTITITLDEGWSLQDVGSSVKIQPYDTTPPASNPSPGRFQYKGTSLTVKVKQAAFYGIHLDAAYKIKVECPK